MKPISKSKQSIKEGDFDALKKKLQGSEYQNLATKFWGVSLIVDRCFHAIKKGEFERDRQFLENMFWSINVEDIQKACLKIEEYVTKELESLQQITSKYINQFKQRHDEVCYHIASLKPWGQE